MCVRFILLGLSILQKMNVCVGFKMQNRDTAFVWRIVFKALRMFCYRQELNDCGIKRTKKNEIKFEKIEVEWTTKPKGDDDGERAREETGKQEMNRLNTVAMYDNHIFEIYICSIRLVHIKSPCVWCIFVVFCFFFSHPTIKRAYIKIYWTTDTEKKERDSYKSV